MLSHESGSACPISTTTFLLPKPEGRTGQQPLHTHAGQDRAAPQGCQPCNLLQLPTHSVLELLGAVGMVRGQGLSCVILVSMWPSGRLRASPQHGRALQAIPAGPVPQVECLPSQTGYCSSLRMSQSLDATPATAHPPRELRAE